MKLKSLEDLFLHELMDLYSAETQLLKALPRLAEAASHESLRVGFEQHRGQTGDHVDRLQQIARMLGVRLGGLKCKAMAGLVEEAMDLLKDDVEPSIRDAGLIGAAQRIEHYEIAGYGTARSLAELLGHGDAATLLEDTLIEEKDTDILLTELAESSINADAASASSDS